MRRHLEPVDLIVAVGVFATLLSGYLMFLAGNGTLAAAGLQSSLSERSVSVHDPMEAMEWVQPALGRAIVATSILEHRAAAETMAVVSELNRATMLAGTVAVSAPSLIEQIRARAAMGAADHAARVQYVLGRSLVTSTQRGVRVGVLSPVQLAGPYNHRTIENAKSRGTMMEDRYLDTREPSLGWQIVRASQDHLQLAEQVQARIGSAILRVAQVQDGYMRAMGSAQEQLASVALASIHTEQIGERFTQLALADRFTESPSVPITMPRSWPDIPVSLLAGGSMALIGLFFIGLLMPEGRQEAPSMRDVRFEPEYRKTA